jgi:predicted PurR-regulated permease PerM
MPDPSIALWTLAVVAVVLFLRAAAQLLIPIALGVLISYALEPVVCWLTRRSIPRVVGTTLVLSVLLLLAGWGVFALKDDVTRAIESLPQIARRAREIVSSNTGSGPAASVQQAASELRGDSSSNPTGTSGQTGSPEGGGLELPRLLQRGVSSVFALAGHILVIFFLVFFLLLSGNHVKDRLVEIAGADPERRRTTARILDSINAQIQRFLLVRLVTAAIVGGLTWIVLAWMGVQNAAVWGILAGVFNSIPYFGPVIVSGGLLLVGLLQGGGLSQALPMSGAALVITSLEGWLLTPPLMGKAERMSALAVFLGLLLWTWIWGAWGTILAVPMLVVLKSVADHVDSLKPVGRLLAP